VLLQITRNVKLYSTRSFAVRKIDKVTRDVTFVIFRLLFYKAIFICIIITDFYTYTGSIGVWNRNMICRKGNRARDRLSRANATFRRYFEEDCDEERRGSQREPDRAYRKAHRSNKNTQFGRMLSLVDASLSLALRASARFEHRCIFPNDYHDQFQTRRTEM